MNRRWLAASLVIASIATGASSCSGPSQQGDSCSDGRGKWIEDESGILKSGYTVIVRICVDDGGNVIDLEVD